MNASETNNKSTEKNDSITKKLADTPYPAWTMATLCLGSSGMAVRQYPGMPSIWTVVGFGLIFSFSGYMTYTGDFFNGGGTTTSWSLIYTLFNAEKSIKSRKPLPILMTSLALSNAYIYGKNYFYLK
ncbi:hypothetical protein RclHR1_23280002 [Rhizophagus clarus]|uniref:Altered inheritance of mitochondria protein 19 homolog n=1 Tax=Rhizophagus clarus TaxID=94130 RepID=A0A2Z6QWD9_9GLOM|nr:hypothetical protein RclHR1_23280002 [Rhizophagus clarus]